jgi:hypothetical protein
MKTLTPHPAAISDEDGVVMIVNGKHLRSLFAAK